MAEEGAGGKGKPWVPRAHHYGRRHEEAPPGGASMWRERGEAGAPEGGAAAAQVEGCPCGPPARALATARSAAAGLPAGRQALTARARSAAQRGLRLAGRRLPVRWTARGPAALPRRPSP